MDIKNMYNKMIDMTNIFGLFVPGEELDGTKTATNLDELKTKPIFHVGMYKKLLLNHVNFNTKVLNFFKNSNQEFDISDIKEAGEYVVFNRAWSYISNVDIKNKGYIDALKHYSDDEFYSTLDMGIEFFQQDELYERCAFLLKIKKKSLKFKK
tara:strand:- start:15 stop:473 length:459 start_codon:yes stop_codon:yes gene_type:complete